MVLIIVFSLLIFAYGLLSHRLEKTVFTGPLIFTLSGIVLSILITREGDVILSGSAFTWLGKIALALVLFTDATRIWVSDMARSTSIPGRLLGIGMPLTIVFGAMIALLLFTDLDLWEAAILATILAPTDAGLGQVIIHSKLIPIRIRQALNVEAGLNDGFALPLLMLFVALARVEQPLEETSWVVYSLQQIGFGILAGVSLGLVGGWLLRGALHRDWVTPAFQQLCLLSLMVVTFLAAEQLGGNEFIAVFFAGLSVKIGFEDAGEEMVEFSEAWGALLNFLVFFIFGLTSANALAQAGARAWIYAILSLTLIRMLPVAIALAGSGLHRSTVIFLGWFGPRGLASIALGLIFIKQEANLPGQNLITVVTTAVVLLSIIAHGLSALPGTRFYIRAAGQFPPDAEENQTSLFNPLEAP